MKKIVYVFDDINYQSGAQKAALYQMQCLSKKYDIYTISLSKPVRPSDIPGKIIQLEKLWKNTWIYTKSLREVILSKCSILQKAERLFYAISTRMGSGANFLNLFLYEEIASKLKKFDVVIVVSEASKLRYLVGGLDNPKKIQWIHTDYQRWSQYSEWTRAITKNDSRLYKRYDYIVVLSDSCREGTIEKMPELCDKVVVIPNMVNFTEIQRKSLESTDFLISKRAYNFLTVGRLDKEKNFDRILGVCKCLADDGVDFAWYIIGDGPLKDYIERRIKELDLQKNVVLLGRLENPYPVMKQCDIFVLLSDYEGTPVTIDEAAVLGLFVIATSVGGVPEQLQRYGCGTVLEVSDDLYRKFKETIELINYNMPSSMNLVNNQIFDKWILIIEK